MSFKFGKVYHTKIQSFKGGCWRCKLTCAWNLQSLSYEDTKNQGWTLALQTYTVREIGNVYHTTIPKLKGGCWRSNLQCIWNLQNQYKHTKFKGGHWRYKLTVFLKFANATIQRYLNSRVDVDVTNLQCPWNLPSLPYKDTKFQGWTFKDVVVTNSRCPWSLQSLQWSDAQIQGWTLALQTYSVLEISKVYTIQRFKHSRGDIGFTNSQCHTNLQSLLYKNT